MLKRYLAITETPLSVGQAEGLTENHSLRQYERLFQRAVTPSSGISRFFRALFRRRKEPAPTSKTVLPE